MDRPMIVGAEHDYDKLLTVAGEGNVETGGYPAHYEAEVGAAYPQPPYPYPPQARYPMPYRPPAPPPMQYPQPRQYAPQPPPPQHVPHQVRHVVNEPLSKSRDFPIGFSEFNIPPGPPVEIEVKPQVLFKGKRLAVAPSIAKDFVIVDIKVGTSAQLAATGEMSAEAFSALAVDTKMEFDTAAPGTTITIRVRNISAQNSNFLAVLYGAVMT